MMWWRWFKKSEPVVQGKKKTALLFAINDYKGSQNDLNGCIHDQDNMEKMLNKNFPGFIIKKFKNSEVTRGCFISEVSRAIKELKSGDVLIVHYSGHGCQVLDTHGDDKDGYDEAIYLYDGAVIDDDIGYELRNIPEGAVVCLMFDSCFSGTVTRILNSSKHPAKNRFMPINDEPLRKNKTIRIPKEEMKHVVYSGCQEYETSADAWVNGQYEGIFTHYALKVLEPSMTYKQWIEAINKQLPNSIYKQTPTMEGNELLFNTPIFT
jgi:hypothetical protein